MKRSPPQIKVYNPPPLKHKHATIEKLKKRHGLLSEQGNKDLLNDISSYSSPQRDVHLASAVKRGQSNDLGELLKNQNSALTLERVKDVESSYEVYSLPRGQQRPLPKAITSQTPDLQKGYGIAIGMDAPQNQAYHYSKQRSLATVSYNSEKVAGKNIGNLNISRSQTRL